MLGPALGSTCTLKKESKLEIIQHFNSRRPASSLICYCLVRNGWGEEWGGKQEYYFLPCTNNATQFYNCLIEQALKFREKAGLQRCDKVRPSVEEPNLFFR